MPSKPRPSAEENRVRQADRLRLLRRRLAIGRELDNRGITAVVAVGEAMGLPAAEAASLLARKVFRDGDLAQLEAAAVRLGLLMPGEQF